MVVEIHPNNSTNITCSWCKNFLDHFAGQKTPYNYSTVVAYPRS
jgi:hypothetical protein